MPSETRVLAHRDGPALVFGIIALMGGVCPVCGHGTRVTSKRWARCKRDGCDGRAQRRTADEARAIIEGTPDPETSHEHP